MTGQVTPFREARVALEVRGAGAQSMRVEAVVDTGFTGALTLPARLITALSLSPVSSTQVMLADGSLVPANVYAGDVLWDGVPRRVRIHQAEGDVLAGMSLMQGCLLTVEIVDGGRVTITPLT